MVKKATGGHLECSLHAHSFFFVWYIIGDFYVDKHTDRQTWATCNHFIIDQFPSVPFFSSSFVNCENGPDFVGRFLPFEPFEGGSRRWLIADRSRMWKLVYLGSFPSFNYQFCTLLCIRSENGEKKGMTKGGESFRNLNCVPLMNCQCSTEESTAFCLCGTNNFFCFFNICFSGLENWKYLPPIIKKW